MSENVYNFPRPENADDPKNLDVSDFENMLAKGDIAGVKLILKNTIYSLQTLISEIPDKPRVESQTAFDTEKVTLQERIDRLEAFKIEHGLG